MQAWSQFLGKGKVVAAKKVKGTDEYTDPQLELFPRDKFSVSEREGAEGIRPEWAWSLMETDETGVRRCWLSQRTLEDGECMIHIGGNMRRGVHVSQLSPEQWDWILGEPYGGDARIMGALKAKYTREGKKA